MTAQCKIFQKLPKNNSRQCRWFVNLHCWAQLTAPRSLQDVIFGAPSLHMLSNPQGVPMVFASSCSGLTKINLSRGAEEHANRNRMRGHNTGKLGNECWNNIATQYGIWVGFPQKLRSGFYLFSSKGKNTKETLWKMKGRKDKKCNRSSKKRKEMRK